MGEAQMDQPTRLSVNALLQALRDAGMQPRVVYAEHLNRCCATNGRSGRAMRIACPYDPAEYAPVDAAAKSAGVEVTARKPLDAWQATLPDALPWHFRRNIVRGLETAGCGHGHAA